MLEEQGNNSWLFCRKVQIQGGPAPTTLIPRGVKAFAWPGGVWASTGQVDSSRELWNNSKTDPIPAKGGTEHRGLLSYSGSYPRDAEAPIALAQS